MSCVPPRGKGKGKSSAEDLDKMLEEYMGPDAVPARASPFEERTSIESLVFQSYAFSKHGKVLLRTLLSNWSTGASEELDIAINQA